MIMWKEYFKNEYHKMWISRSEAYEFDKYGQTILGMIQNQNGSRILECGIGTGKPMAVNIAKKGGGVYGIDLSLPSLKACNKNLLEANLGANLTQGDIDTLPFKSGSFDICYSISTTWYIQDIEKAIMEMVRVTNKEGILIFDIINYLHPFQFLNYQYAKLYQTLRYVKRSICRLPKDNCFVDYIPRTPLQVKKILNKMKVKYEVKGFFVLLPTSLPLFDIKGNLAKYSSFFSYKLQNSKLLRFFGAKVVFICKKVKD